MVRVELVFTGTLSKYHDLGCLRSAIDQLPQQIRESLVLKLVGASVPVELPCEVRVLDYMPKDMIESEVAGAAILLLPYIKEVPTQSKMWDYIEWHYKYGIEVLCFCEPGTEMGRIIKDCDAGTCIEPDDTETTVKFLQKHYLQQYSIAWLRYSDWPPPK